MKPNRKYSYRGFEIKFLKDDMYPLIVTALNKRVCSMHEAKMAINSHVNSAEMHKIAKKIGLEMEENK